MATSNSTVYPQPQTVTSSTGFDANDPFLGLNIGLSTNLVIGLDALQEATVNTNSYAVDQGRYGASQIDYFTKSGTNRFHGDVYEIWNGSLFNATDYFLHANDTPGNIATKPRSTVNQFGVSVGGPILRNKLFFFAHYEGIRIALPIVARSTVPSSVYQQYVLQQLPLGGTDPVNGTVLPAQAAEVDFYRNMFSLYDNTTGTPTPVLSCPLDSNGALLPSTQTAANLFNGNGCANIRTKSLNNSDKEDLIVLKIDYTINAKNTVWYKYQQDTGLQAAYTDPVNAIFNAYSPQPQRTAVVGYTHIFSPNLVNQFNPGASWYSSVFLPNNYPQVLQRFPIVLAGGSSNAPFTTVGGNNQTYTQGRKVTQWQINDNLIWTRGRHNMKFGVNTRRLDISDYDLGEGVVPTVIYNDLAQFTYGAASTVTRAFPVTQKERIANGNLDMYAMDTFRVQPEADADSRPASDVEYELCQSAWPVRPSRRFVSRYGPRPDAASQSGDADKCAESLSGYSAHQLAASRFDRLQALRKAGVTCRWRHLQRHRPRPGG